MASALSKIQTRILRLRGLGYTGVQFNSLLISLLVFKLSNSLMLAGMALMIELAPKLLLYITGGSIIQRVSPTITHISLESARAALLILLGIGGVYLGSLWIVALCAALYQVTNAFSNILFEQLVTNWWRPEQHQAGHTNMVRFDQWGCLLALGCSLLIHDPVYLLLIAIVIQLTLTTAVLKQASQLHTYHVTSPPNVWLQIKQDASYVANKELLLYSLYGMFLVIPQGLFFSTIIFYLNRLDPAHTDNTFWLSLVLGARVVLSIVSLGALRRSHVNDSPEKTHNLIYWSLCIYLISGIFLIGKMPIVLWCAMLVLFGACAYMLIPWQRQVRQALIQRYVPPQSQSGATGMLISVEASSYVVAGALMAFSQNALTRISWVAMAFALLGAWGLWRKSNELMSQVQLERHTLEEEK